MRVVRAYGQEEAELERFGRANAEYLERNRSLIRLQGLFFPSMSLFLGLGALLVLWLGSREVIAGRITVGELRRVQRLPRDAVVADDRVRVGHQHGSARAGVVDADARGARRGAGYRRPGSGPAGGAAGAVAGDIEFRDLTFAVRRRRPVLRRRVGAHPGGPDRGARRPDRLGQVDAHQPAAATLRPAARNGVRRRRRRARPGAGPAARRHRSSFPRRPSCSPSSLPTTSRSAPGGADAGRWRANRVGGR